MQRSKRFTPEILEELGRIKYSYLRELAGHIAGFSIDFFPIYLILGLFILRFLRVEGMTLFAASAICIIYSFFHFYKIFVDSDRIVLNKYTIKIPELKKAVKFVFVSDMHYGPESYGASKRKLRHMIDLINSVDTDLVIYGGDFVCEEIPHDINTIFNGVKAKNQIGIYGNHDSLYLKEHQSTEEPLEFFDAMKGSKIKLLVNSGTKYQDIFFGGITDIYSMNLDIDKAFKRGTKDSVKILLSHSPDILDFLKPEDNIKLVLSGHTHGGQIYIKGIGPILPIPCRDTSLVKGLYNRKNVQLFISQGAGFSKTRMRIGTECEVCEITLIP